MRNELDWVEQVRPSLGEEAAAGRRVRLGGCLLLRRGRAARVFFLGLGDAFADLADFSDLPYLAAIDNVNAIDDINAIDDVDPVVDLPDCAAVDDLGNMATIDNVEAIGNLAALGDIDDMAAVDDIDDVALYADCTEVVHVNGVAEVANVSKFAVGPIVALIIDHVADVDAVRCVANFAYVSDFADLGVIANIYPVADIQIDCLVLP